MDTPKSGPPNLPLSVSMANSRSIGGRPQDDLHRAVDGQGPPAPVLRLRRLETGSQQVEQFVEGLDRQPAERGERDPPRGGERGPEVVVGGQRLGLQALPPCPVAAGIVHPPRPATERQGAARAQGGGNVHRTGLRPSRRRCSFLTIEGEEMGVAGRPQTECGAEQSLGLVVAGSRRRTTRPAGGSRWPPIPIAACCPTVVRGRGEAR